MGHRGPHKDTGWVCPLQHNLVKLSKATVSSTLGLPLGLSQVETFIQKERISPNLVFPDCFCQDFFQKVGMGSEVESLHEDRKLLKQSSHCKSGDI